MRLRSPSVAHRLPWKAERFPSPQNDGDIAQQFQTGWETAPLSPAPNKQGPQAGSTATGLYPSPRTTRFSCWSLTGTLVRTRAVFFARSTLA